MLEEYLTRGYTLNRHRVEQNARELEAALKLVQRTAAGDGLTTDQGRGLVDVIARYTQTFLLLQRYDEGLLTVPKGGSAAALNSARFKPIIRFNNTRHASPWKRTRRVTFFWGW